MPEHESTLFAADPRPTPTAEWHLFEGHVRRFKTTEELTEYLQGQLNDLAIRLSKVGNEELGRSQAEWIENGTFQQILDAYEKGPSPRVIQLFGPEDGPFVAPEDGGMPAPTHGIALWAQGVFGNDA